MRNTPEARLLQRYPQARRNLAIAVGLQSCAALTLIGQAWLLSAVIGGVFLRGQQFGDTMPLLVGVSALVVVRALLAWVAETIAQRAANALKRGARSDATAHVQRLGPLFTRNERGGSLVQTLTEHVEALDEYASQFLPARHLAAIIPVIMVLAVLLIDPLTTLVLLFAGPILILLLALIGQKTRALTDQRFAELRWMGAYFLDMLRGLPTLKLFGRSREQVEMIDDIGSRYRTTTMDVLRTAFQTSLVLEWGATAATALVAIEVSWRLLMGFLPFEPALTVLLLAPEFFAPLRMLAQKYHAGTTGAAASTAIMALLDTAPEQAHSGTLPPPAPADIQLHNVVVRYRAETPPALDHCSLTIPHGKITALVGATGAGKSTIAQLLLGFVSPSEGTIMVGETPFNALDIEEWRSQLAYVPQRPHLFAGSVASNIRLGCPNATMAQIEAAARAAEAHSFIASLPQGYNTPLGENGARLSGGQRQRIALARAFLRNAPLLIFDEATAHLDDTNEQALFETIGRYAQGRTVVLIAHRLRMAYNADQVLVLEQGRVVASGTHHELLEHSSAYRAQVQRYEEQLA